MLWHEGRVAKSNQTLLTLDIYFNISIRTVFKSLSWENVRVIWVKHTLHIIKFFDVYKRASNEYIYIEIGFCYTTPPLHSEQLKSQHGIVCG